MAICSVLLAAALTRAELIERFKAPPLTKVSGLVQVVADCPAEMRREYQSPIALFASEVCKALYRSDRMQPVYFKEPGIVVYIGDGRTNDTRVVVREGVRESGAKYTRLTLPAPGTADLGRLRMEIVRAYFRAVKDRTIDALKHELARKDSELAARMEKEFDLQERNPNALALLDREIEVPDRFPGETRDHVLEVIAAARAVAEAEGRVRKAQLLEAVLMANEPNGLLAKRREELEKLFSENNNLVNGPVLEELKNRGISHKNGEDYLLPSEIMKRNY